MSRELKVVLVYPPPWKIAAAGGPAYPRGEGPPRGREEHRIEGDMLGPPYGLLQLAAQGRREGHRVEVINLASFAWPEVEQAIADRPADLYGVTCLTTSRRGCSAVFELIKRCWPEVFLVAGGPHASALPREILDREPPVDLVVVGEGELTFVELCERLSRGGSLRGIAGTAYRDEAGGAHLAPRRARRADLDQLEPVHHHFDTPFLLTSRGCPGRCTFCGSRASWGHRVRFSGVEAVLAALEVIVRRRGHPLVAIKDDTFTANRNRAMAICRGIERRGLRLIWTCDTRADSLDEELLVAMRRAGCQQISLGVESGSPAVLERIGKKVTVEQIGRATALARSVGIGVRYYLILGCPGETFATLDETFALIERDGPEQVVFSPMSIYPGTADFDRLLEGGAVTLARYLEADFLTPTFPLEIDDDDVRLWIAAWLKRCPGVVGFRRPTVREARAALARLPDCAAQHMDLAITLVEAGEHDEVEGELARAEELGYPLAGVAENLRAGLAAARGDVKRAARWLERAAAGYPMRHVELNRRRLADPAMGDGPLELIPRPSFEVAESMVQPLNPGLLQRSVER